MLVAQCHAGEKATAIDRELRPRAAGVLRHQHTFQCHMGGRDMAINHTMPGARRWGDPGPTARTPGAITDRACVNVFKRAARRLDWQIFELALRAQSELLDAQGLLRTTLGLLSALGLPPEWPRRALAAEPRASFSAIFAHSLPTPSSSGSQLRRGEALFRADGTATRGRLCRGGSAYRVRTAARAWAGTTMCDKARCRSFAARAAQIRWHGIAKGKCRYSATAEQEII